MTHNVLVLNAGSSSVKFAIINFPSKQEILSGTAECLGQSNARLSWVHHGINVEPSDKVVENLPENASHNEAIKRLVDITSQLSLTESISAIGHRVVHGGEKFSASVFIDQTVLNEIKLNAKLAPLHNPANIQGIEATQKCFPHLAQIAVFDTAFHQTLNEEAYLYAIPYALYQLEGIRKYGFHGTSHSFVAKQAAALLEKPSQDINVITAHLGNGCSICAVKQGESIDTSMGFTPLAGVAMGTRSGDIDPGLLFYLVNELDYSPEQLEQLLNKESGLLGLSQVSNDVRTLEQAKNDGNEQAALALRIFCYQIAKTIAAFTVPLKTLDAIVFTGGIGENSAFVRACIIEHLAIFNLQIDEQANLANRFGQAGCITKGSDIKGLVIPTNEELVIAQDALTIALQQETK